MWTREELEELSKRYEERKARRRKNKRLKRARKILRRTEHPKKHSDWLIPLYLMAIFDEIRRKL